MNPIDNHDHVFKHNLYKDFFLGEFNTCSFMYTNT